ncbi:PRC-barrel domain-containing protein [Desulfotruncus alcoholivorax]|uniref:PRC-barrel domain-containing protein n=1 Tax=Desulfotruncus alcoholivorax TaxID=265477 RepID=UPI000414126E|nr:PRC-barrel domain-containing protein [Desulfotruncus alcoholivorax]
MRKSKQFYNLPVISLEEGTQIGIIKGLIINPADKKVVALAVDQKGWFNDQKFIPYGKIHSVGEDAVTVNRSAIIQKGNSLPEIIGLVKEKNNISGARIISESGTMLGIVDDYYVNLASGDIVGLEFGGGYLSGVYSGSAFLDIDHVLTIGKEMIVCTDEAMEKAVKLDGGLQDRLRGVSKTTGKLLETTVQKSKRIGSNLGSNVTRSISRLKWNKDDNSPQDEANPEEPPKQ